MHGRVVGAQFLDPDWYFEHVLFHATPGGVRTPAVDLRPVAVWDRWWDAIAHRPDPLVAASSAHGFVLSVAQLDGFGVSRSRRRNEIRQGRWTAAGEGFLAPFSVVEPGDGPQDSWLHERRLHALRTAARFRARPGSLVSGRSAATLRGLPTMAVPSLPELTDREATHGRLDASHLFAARVPGHERSSWYGIDVESVGRTLVTLARHSRRDAIMAADAALREDLIDHRGIQLALDTARGWPWVRRARAVLALADGRAESPLESITRLALHDSGFPPPDLQVVFGDDRVDHYWKSKGLVLEADGAGKYVGNAWLRERKREGRLLADPRVRKVERVEWDDVVRTWPVTEARLRPYFR